MRVRLTSLYMCVGCPLPWCRAGQYLPLLCTLNCAGVVEEVRNSFNLSHEELTALAATERSGAVLMLPYFQVASWLGRAPAPAACGAPMRGPRGPDVFALYGPPPIGRADSQLAPRQWSHHRLVPCYHQSSSWGHPPGPTLPVHSTPLCAGLRPGLLRPGVLYRAALEGVTFSLLAGMRRLESYGLKASELRVVGGGSHNRLWRRIIADAFQVSGRLGTELEGASTDKEGRRRRANSAWSHTPMFCLQLPLRFPAEAESAALGAALQAAAVFDGVPVAEYISQHAVPLEEGVLQPNSEVAAAYEEAFQRHQHWGAAMFGSCSSEAGGAAH